MLVHERTGQKRGNGEAKKRQMRSDGRHSSRQDDFAYVGDVAIDGVEGKGQLQRRREFVDRVEDRRPVHDELYQNRPEVVDVPEEDEERRKDHADADVEQQQRHDGIDKEQEPPRERHVV